MAKTYFVSDVHLGLDAFGPKERERYFTAFLRTLPEDTDSLYLLGDIWDFWYEYRDVVPRGYVRVLGALADLVDRGVKVYFFQGNHDVWTYSYFREEIGMIPLEQPYIVDISGKRFCLGHGDGLGPGDRGYKFLRGIFHNGLLQTMFSFLHPWVAFRLGNTWSKGNRLSERRVEPSFAEIAPRLVSFASDFSAANGHVDYFIFGHYHSQGGCGLDSGGQLYVLGDWITGKRNYLVFDDVLGMKSGYFQNNE